MSSQPRPGPAVKRRRLPTFADLALISAIALVLALSWHGLPNPHVQSGSAKDAPTKTAAK